MFGNNNLTGGGFMVEYVGYLAMVVAVVGTFINAARPMNRVCFYLWVASNTTFVVLSCLADQVPQTVVFSANLVACVIGLCARAKGKKVDKCCCGADVHPQLGKNCIDCFFNSAIEAPDGDYIREDGDIFLMPEGVMLQS